tara:strand:+ start:7499 stop:7933 length:435 start_codon:yes stop_codon:yes gene_type:complete
VCPERVAHEEWDLEAIQTTLHRIATLNEFHVKYCFFIDGLDEYGGAEEELVETLQFLSMSNTIKICASTRPRRPFQHFFRNSNRMFDISTFTKEDMRLYVWKGLQENKNFLELQKHAPECEDIVKMYQIWPRVCGYGYIWSGEI